MFNATISQMIYMIDEPNRAACYRLYADNDKLFKAAFGSLHNHQAWDGGYLDHIAEVMNICLVLYPIYNKRELNFSLSDALLVMLLHDLEKPWRDELPKSYGKDIVYVSKKDRQAFREKKYVDYGIKLTEQHLNALKYVEGEGGDYSNKHRVMNELAAFCHIADVSSARIWHDYPRETT